MFSFRSFVVIAATIYLLPTDPAQQQRFMEKALAAATWTTTFCDRNAAACGVAQAAWTEMKQKASFAAAVAYDIATRKPTATEAIAEPRAGERPRVLPVSASAAGASGTLTADDLRPIWRGHPPP